MNNSSLINPSADTLDRLPSRAFNFLSAVAGNAAVREALEARGYTLAVHQQGWSLVDEVAGRVTMAPAPTPERDAVVDEATDEIDAWGGTNFGVARAALQHRFPAQYAYLFANDLQAQRGNGSVLAVLTLLRRLDNLERAPEREATRAQDHAALEVLTQRGIGPAQRAHMMSRVVVAQNVTPVASPSPVTGRAPAAPAAPATRNPKHELYVWYAEWSGVARAVIKQRKHLIRLGLASPRKPKPAAPPAPQRPSVAPPQ